MAAKKEGELRVRKGESVYGPMTRADFDGLLASGRFSLSDFISVWGGPWIEVIRFVAQAEGGGNSQAVSKPLRVLRGDHIFSSLDQQQVSQLVRDGRIDNDDLVSAMGGPWMSVADFLSPPRPLEPLRIREPEPIAKEPWEYIPPKWYHAYRAALEEQLSDQWFVRIRGIHSAPLNRQQIQHLFVACELTTKNVARHCTWPENRWIPIHSIPELAGVDKPYD
jgi:hypothetical protein